MLETCEFGVYGELLVGMIEEDDYKLTCGHFSTAFVICDDDCMTLALGDGKELVIK
jgi:hypothetical protein